MEEDVMGWEIGEIVEDPETEEYGTIRKVEGEGSETRVLIFLAESEIEVWRTTDELGWGWTEGVGFELAD